ncbi:MAG: hypothetical protein KDC98_13200 [Planctomycetes bacterium]|nr:hypothetical protein [Planctomycetota bacterium]
MIPVPPSLRRIAEEIDGWLDLKCPERALVRIDALLAHEGGRHVGLAMRIRAYVALARHREALADIEELREVVEARDWLDLCEAWCRKRLADLPGAIRCMERLVQRNPKSDIGHFNLGCYLALAGELGRAIDEVTIACGLDDELRDLARNEPDLDSLRADSRFRALMRTQPPASERD